MTKAELVAIYREFANSARKEALKARLHSIAHREAVAKVNAWHDAALLLEKMEE